ncbi:hypothetical protein HDV00_010242 [Rhizophlyctis rosea]|nr:hypothetical protein HDV00_010242 [Rhizophlyctis rosea]
MPEAPEVERVRKLLEDNFVGDVIKDVTTFEDEIVYANCKHTEFAVNVISSKVVKAGRWGKVFWLDFENKDVHPVMHLGMTGSVQIKGELPLAYRDQIKRTQQWPPKYTKFILKFNSGKELAFTDPRRLARIRLVKGDVHSQAPVSDLGFDPLINLPELDEFCDLIKKRSMPIKSLLLDQSFSAGVGNWVADEVLFQAQVHPAQNTQTLTDDELSHLHDKIGSVLQRAVEVNADSTKFPESWLFHYRWDKAKRGHKPTMPTGELITYETVGGRTSAIVQAVQKLRKLGTKVKKVAVTSRKKKGKITLGEVEEELSEVVAEPVGDGQTTMTTSRAKRKKAQRSDESSAVADGTGTGTRRSKRLRAMGDADVVESITAAVTAELDMEGGPLTSTTRSGRVTSRHFGKARATTPPSVRKKSKTSKSQKTFPEVPEIENE